MCESLFGIGRRRALDLMQRFGGYRAGNSILIDRPAFIQQLQRMLEGPGFEQERQRKRRLSEHLTELEKHCRGAAVRIPVGPEIVHLIPAGLPSGIFFGPARLTTDYGNVEELVRRLYEVAQAAANDFDQFSELAMPNMRTQRLQSNSRWLLSWRSTSMQYSKSGDSSQSLPHQPHLIGVGRIVFLARARERHALR